MREILFRGKCLGRLYKKGFVFGSLGVIDTDLVAIYQCKEFTEDVKFLVDLGTVGQYTGLTDKNGTKIFEGDIVSHFVNGKEFKGVVRYADGAFGIRCEGGAGQFLCFCNNGEVIGNIHDNPELLKGGEG